jgi:hypothetical protein
MIVDIATGEIEDREPTSGVSWFMLTAMQPE